MRKRNIYIIQMHSRTIPARLIKFVTKYTYSHVGICLDKECNTIYSFGRKRLNNFFIGGFVIEKKTGVFFQKFNQTVCRIYELEVNRKQYQKLKKYLSYMEKNKSKYKYDYLGIILRTFHIPIHFKNSYVCSQFVAELLEKTKIHQFDKKTYFVKPEDFDQIKGMKEIYTGKYLLYEICCNQC